jgi:hypothetical protein
MNKTLLAASVAIALCGAALAKLPAPDDATKAKAAEAAAKAGWQAKVDAYLLCKAQDRVVAIYRKTAAGKPAVAAASATASASAPSAAASAPPAAALSVAKPASAAASAAPTTPVAASAPSPCADPGPFAYNQPDQKPLETSGAHSPAGTAASPPSVRSESATMVPGKKP